MKHLIPLLLLCWTPLLPAADPAVKAYEGTLTVPTYEPQGRETEPALFANSTVTGMYPFTTYVMPFQPGGPKPHTYRAIFIENEYLKLTSIPEFGGRFFSLYDKIRGKEVFYRNDVIKPAPYNPRVSWVQSGIELTGPHDLHMLTLHGEPFWSDKVVRHADGSVSLVLGELDPVYHMKVNLAATLHPGVAAMEITVFCYNTRDARMPQMLWMNTALPATPKTRFIYPMTRTVGHTTADIADWPLYNGIDYSLDRNNQHMLGVFGIDIYDNFQGAYQFENDYGVFRYADRRIVQGMKLWTFGYGAGSKSHEEGYTDKAGPYVEVQSGRHVWDGHYEWVAPHKVESWSEWWVPVAGTGGLTTLSRDVALKLDVQDASVALALAVTRAIPHATVVVTGAQGEIGQVTADLDPAHPFQKTFSASAARAVRVIVRDAQGQERLNYVRPDGNPGRIEYTPFTRPLEQPKKSPEQMGVEELVLAAEFKVKELDVEGATVLLNQALARDPGYSRAHLVMGTNDFVRGRYESAVEHLEKTIARDPYSDEAYYYLSLSQFALGRDREAERNLYFIWPNSAYFGEREYNLGRLAALAHDSANAAGHFRRAIATNAYDLTSRLSLAIVLRESGDAAGARKALEEAEEIDPTNRLVHAERYFLNGEAGARAEFLRLSGAQTQEALDISAFYRRLRRWKEAVAVLDLIGQNNRDPWGTTPEFYYVLAYCRRQAGDTSGADAALEKARASAGNIDRAPYREDSEAPLAEAVKLNPKDSVARFGLACLLYYRERPQEAIREWQAAAEAAPENFSIRRALGLALAEQGAPVEQAAAQLERAVALKPAHVRTLNDLSSLYSRAGRFEEQLAVLKKALDRSPADDDLAEGVLTANLSIGRYDAAEQMVNTHKFAVRHRSYGLRDKYRVMRYATASQAFKKGDYATALKLYQAAFNPPVSLGVDDFVSQTSPRLQYYIGLTLEKLGKSAEARQAYEKGVTGVPQLSGDRDSWNAENYFMLLSLKKLGRDADVTRLLKHFEDFANGEKDSRNAIHRGQARYLLALIRKDQGQAQEARALIGDALKALPDLLPARMEMRGDVPDPML